MKAVYIPGRRNIGQNEVRRRRRSGFIGSIATVLLYVALHLAGTPPMTRFLLAIPILIATLGFIQASNET